VMLSNRNGAVMHVAERSEVNVSYTCCTQYVDESSHFRTA